MPLKKPLRKIDTKAEIVQSYMDHKLAKGFKADLVEDFTLRVDRLVGFGIDLANALELAKWLQELEIRRLEHLEFILKTLGAKEDDGGFTAKYINETFFKE